MVLEIGDWVFDIDLTATMEYSAGEAADHCTCGYCRNYYLMVDDALPGLRPFLAQFGVDVEAPEEMLAYGYNGSVNYDICYSVIGLVLKKGKSAIIVDGKSMTVESVEDSQIDCRCPEPCFVLSIRLTCPWVLDEDLETVISPANKPSFLEQTLNKRLRLDKENAILS